MRVPDSGPEGLLKESLADRLALGPLPILEALRYATEVAAAVRDLHNQGVAHGAVSSRLIMLGESGVTLTTTGKTRCLGDKCLDVKAFGEVLDDVLGGDDSEGDGSTSVRHQMHALALRCRNESPSIQQVLLYLRLTALQTRQPKLRTRAAMPNVRLRIRLALHSRALSKLVFVLLQKIT
jgi:serine/threonine protein kinase